MTVVVAILATAALGLVALIAQLGLATVARHRAAAAADFAALAGAAEILAGQSAACDRAAELARAGGAELNSCEAVGLDLQVTVSVPVGALGLSATARARAGPQRSGWP